jgi:response regulator RpfG family c-di-GMP phosphodiesterase
MPWPELIELIRSQSGRHFDPEVVEAFLRLAPGRQGHAA